MAINSGQILAPVSQALGNLSTMVSPVPLPTVPLSVEFGLLTGGALPQENFPLLAAARAALLPGIATVPSLSSLITQAPALPALAPAPSQPQNDNNNNGNNEDRNGDNQRGSGFSGGGGIGRNPFSASGASSGNRGAGGGGRGVGRGGGGFGGGR